MEKPRGKSVYAVDDHLYKVQKTKINLWSRSCREEGVSDWEGAAVLGAGFFLIQVLVTGECLL